MYCNNLGNSYSARIKWVHAPFYLEESLSRHIDVNIELEAALSIHLINLLSK